MNSVLREILDTHRVKSAKNETIELHSGSVSLEEGEFLHGIVSELEATISLEVGLAHGISALFICDALEKTNGTRHIIMDPYQVTDPPWGDDSFKGVGLDNLRRAGYEDIIEFHGQPSHLVLPQLEAQGIQIDFAFIDGWHTFDHTLVDFFYIDRLLKVGGVVAIDDANWPSVNKVCQFIAKNRAYTVLRCLNPGFDSYLPLTRRLLRRIRYAPAITYYLVRQLAPGSGLGLVPGSRCVAFKKQAHDSRRWDFHRSF